MVVAREREQAQLRQALASPDPELIAVYGRRRIGKTYLVRQFFADQLVFELTGSHAGDMATQLEAFATALGRATRAPGRLARPADWTEAFRQLEAYLTALPRADKRVVFLDELPWLATRRSGFLAAFEHFWNGWGSAQPWLVVVICGSAASWMLQKVIRQRGGLHNRVTRRLRLAPLTLGETERYLQARGVQLGRYQLLELSMALGGVPHYLNQAQPGRSAAQIIDEACFQRDGALRGEFHQLYAALFERAERHEAVIRALATRGGLERAELLAAVGFPSGGTSTKVLDELEESGFIARRAPLGRARRNARYQLVDPYSAFFITWIEPHRGAGEGAWQKMRASARFRAWSGLAFEGLCLQHVAAIKRNLGFAAVRTEEAPWRYVPVERGEDGAQIDLVIDRADNSVTLCEMKFAEGEYVIDKGYARALEQKRRIFVNVTQTRKAVFFALVTTFGLQQNDHAQRLGLQPVTMDALFEA